MTKKLSKTPPQPLIFQEKLVIYQAKSGAIELKGDAKRETLWATRMQIAKMFDVNPQAISKHIKNIYNEKELKKQATSSKMELVQLEGKRKITREVKIYNLDTVISIGYRINSKTGTKFRQWATKTLRSHVVEGYTLNPIQIQKNHNSFLRAVDDIKKLISKNSQLETKDVLELIKTFADTWFSLDAYDKNDLPKSGANKKQVVLTGNDLALAITKLKKELMNNEEATSFFAQEKDDDGIFNIVGNVFQSFDGKDLYPTLEEKAAHLLYFVVKDHPFIDGNKRSGAFSFVWFLQKAGILNTSQLSPETLTTLTLLIAESNPQEKNRILGLVLLLLRKNK